MFKRKHLIMLTDSQYRVVVQSLLEQHNTLMRQGRYTDAVDDALLVVLSASKRVSSNSKKSEPHM